MKTAMQELRDSINMSYVHMSMAPETKDIYIYKIALKESLDKIDALLEKEKEQILAAYTNGSQDMAEWGDEKYEPLEYYNETYQNK